jgi:hypothetical protein
MIKMTKHIAATLLAVMLLAQVGVAQHRSVHFTDHSHYEHHQNKDYDSNHNKQSEEICQICLSSQILSMGLIDFQIYLPEPVAFWDDLPQSEAYVLKKTPDAPYNPRAPPIFLI